MSVWIIWSHGPIEFSSVNRIGMSRRLSMHMGTVWEPWGPIHRSHQFSANFHSFESMDCIDWVCPGRRVSPPLSDHPFARWSRWVLRGQSTTNPGSFGKEEIHPGSERQWQLLCDTSRSGSQWATRATQCPGGPKGSKRVASCREFMLNLASHEVYRNWDFNKNSLKNDWNDCFRTTETTNCCDSH